MSGDEAFESITRGLPELAAMDDGVTVTISNGGEFLAVTSVEYGGWVRHLTEHILSRPSSWLEGVTPFSSQPWFVQHAVVLESYRYLAEVAFECGELGLVPELLQVMHQMIVWCRGLQP